MNPRSVCILYSKTLSQTHMPKRNTAYSPGGAGRVTVVSVLVQVFIDVKGHHDSGNS